MRLHDLSIHVRNVLDRYPDGEIPDEALAELDTLTQTLQEKVEAYCQIREEAESRIAARTAVIDRLKAANATDWNLSERLKARLFEAMQIAGTPKIKTDLFSVWIQKSPPALDVPADLDPAELPPRFQRVRVEIDRAKLMDAHKAGETLPVGVTVTQGRHLRIK